MATQTKGLTQEGEGTSVGAGFILPGKKMGMKKEKNKEGGQEKKKKRGSSHCSRTFDVPKGERAQRGAPALSPLLFLALVFCLFFSRFCCASVRCRISAGAGFLSLLQDTSQSLPLQFSLGLSSTLTSSPSYSSLPNRFAATVSFSSLSHICICFFHFF
jgi:hypothetical protein